MSREFSRNPYHYLDRENYEYKVKERLLSILSIVLSVSLVGISVFIWDDQSDTLKTSCNGNGVDATCKKLSLQEN